jgi:hypothetical protein
MTLCVGLDCLPLLKIMETSQWETDYITLFKTFIESYGSTFYVQLKFHSRIIP